VELRGKNVVLAGMGRSAVGAAKLLLARGARPFVSDSNDGPSLDAHRTALDALGVAYECGGHTLRRFEEADLVVLSPGVPPAIAPVAQARARGVPVLGELELAWRFCQSRVLAVTGTNGKTTATELLRAMIAACGRSVALAGNNNTPLSLAVLENPPPEFIVLEVSSYQLENVETFHPWVAAVLNLTPDHLGRHGTMEEYAAMKARIFAPQTRGDAAVVNWDDPRTAAMPVPGGVRRMAFSLTDRIKDGCWADGAIIRHGDEAVAALADNPLPSKMGTDTSRSKTRSLVSVPILPGRHNLANVLAALTMMRAGGFDWEGVLAGLRQFRGVEHRIEHVVTCDGVDYYNDSKSTNVDSLRVALESFDRPVVLIAGGRGKGADYRVLRPLMRRMVKHMVTLGEDAPLLEAAFGDLAPAERAESMVAAVTRARAAASPGDVVLLSPGCASFDMYANFEERGRDFKQCVRTLLAATKETPV